MEITLIGLNYKNAPLEMREKFAFDDSKIDDALKQFSQNGLAKEAVILSTCNRVELYTAVQDGTINTEKTKDLLSRYHKLDRTAFETLLYVYKDGKAVEHIFKVASSLDSMVLGEAQILKQVKEAYQTAKEAGATGKLLNQLFQRALAVGKLIRTTTSIGERNTSVPGVAVKLAEKVFEDLASKKMLIIGAGETGGLALHVFKHRGVSDIAIANRTVEKAKELTQRYGGTAHSLDELEKVLPTRDIVISCVDAKEGEFVISTKIAGGSISKRKGAPQFFIDLGVPRNISPEVNKLDNAYLFTIDDLNAIVNENVEAREAEIEKCEPIIRMEATKFMAELAMSESGELIKDIRSALYELADEEAQKTINDLALSDRDRTEVNYLAKRLANKILHNATEILKDGTGDKRVVFEELLRELFKKK